MTRWGLLAWVWVGLVPAVALAQDSDAKRSVARDLGNEGIQLYEAGDYASALDKLQRAYAVNKAPTLALWLARALAKNGKLVEASERYREVIKQRLEPGAPEVFVEAQQSAEQESKELSARIPSLTVRLEGADVAAAKVTVDGVLVESALVGLPVPVNPGQHEVTASWEARQKTQTVKVAEGEKAAVALAFGDSPPGDAVAPGPAATDGALSSGSGAAGPGEDTGADSGSLQRTLGWVGLGVGAAGVVLGGITGLVASSKKSDLDNSGECLDDKCGPSERDEVESYNSMVTLSTVGFVVGGIGLAAGATLLLTAPSPNSESEAYVAPWVGIASAGIKGRF